MYTCDLEHERLDINHEVDKPELDEKGRPKTKRPKVEAKKRRQEIADQCVNDPKGYKSTFSLLEADDDFRQMRSNYTPEFFERWKVGFQHYINGDWDAAALIFAETKVAPTHPENDPHERRRAVQNSP